MRKIVKSIEPDALTIWKRQHPQGRYADLSNVERLAIRQACLTEQYYLCAYCCKAVGHKPDDCMNEHVEAQDIAPQRVLDLTTSSPVVEPPISVMPRTAHNPYRLRHSWLNVKLS